MKSVITRLVLGIASLQVLVSQAIAAPDALSIVELPQAGKLRPGAVVQSKPFAGKFSGRILWLSANGRYAAMFRLTEDTDKNGKLNIEFGMHGDSWGDELSLDVFDIDSDTYQRFDDLLVGDSQGRFLVLRRDADTFLFDSEDGSARNLRDLGGGAQSDQNACMSPRQIAFDATGEHIALLRDQPAELTIFTPATNSSKVIYRADKPIWRVDFTYDPSHLVITETKDKFPQQRGSCVSRSRTVFAASYSTSGIDQTQLSYAYVDFNGGHMLLSEEPVTLSDSVYALRSGPTVKRFTGAEVAIPEGCKIVDGADGSVILVLACASTTELFEPASGLRHPLPPGESLTLIPGTRTAGRDGTWYAVKFPIKGATDESGVKMHLGRLRLQDLRLERGPAVYFCRSSGNPQWLTGGHDDEYFMFDIASGTTYTAHAKDTETGNDELSLDTGKKGPFLLLDPAGNRQATWPGNAGIGNGRGCFTSVQGKRKKDRSQIDPGPWTRICVSAPPPDVAPPPGS